jgi:hypothetical protein
MICAHEGRPEPEYVHPSWDHPGDPVAAAARIAEHLASWAAVVHEHETFADLTATIRPALEW